MGTRSGLDQEISYERTGKKRLSFWRRTHQRIIQLTGWKRAAVVNCVLIFTILAVLVGALIAFWVESGSLLDYSILATGDCHAYTERLNTVLHLFINILSTGILASTNFFMQILNAPDRKDLDTVHQRGSWLEIGVLSPRNAFRVSKFKTVLYLAFFLSSIPIHVLFNSVIFATDYRESAFTLYIASELFTKGEENGFLPGASLGVPCNDVRAALDPSICQAAFDSSAGNYSYLNTRDSYFAPGSRDGNYTRLRSNPIADQKSMPAWDRLDVRTCQSLYNTTTCSGLHSYRSLVLVVQSPNITWERPRMYDLSSDESSFWDQHWPAQENNTLWFADDTCSMALGYDWDGSFNQSLCQNTCTQEMGLRSTIAMTLARTNTWPYSPLLTSNLNRSFWDHAYDDPRGEFPLIASMTSTPPLQQLDTSIEYCLAEPIHPVCKIGVSKTLLLAVTVCILVKSCLCLVVLFTWGKSSASRPIVTLGDALESFIVRPEPTVEGSCLFDQSTTRTKSRFNGTMLRLPGPRKWRSSPHRRSEAITGSVWIQSYIVFLCGIGLLAYFLGQAFASNGWSSGYFGQDSMNPTIRLRNSPTFEVAVLIANAPQLFLSFAYLAYNNLFTRLQMAKEWAFMSVEYVPLRVTDPKGQQVSTYRLQLPYKYSLPLILVSILLHWLLSGTIYILVLEGSYFDNMSLYAHGGPFDSWAALGYSTLSIKIMLALSTALIFVPPVLGLWRLPPHSLLVGSNSLALAAACHISPLTGQRPPHTDAAPPGLKTLTLVAQQAVALSPESRRLISSTSPPPDVPDGGGFTGAKQMVRTYHGGGASEEDCERRAVVLVKVSQSKLKWGVVRMPEDWGADYPRVGGGGASSVGHISFGTFEDGDVEAPVDGRRYA